MIKSQFVYTFVMSGLLITGCASLHKKSVDQHRERQSPRGFAFSTETVQGGHDETAVEPLDQNQEALMEDFSSKISQIGMGLYPEEVKEILGNPDLVDKETDIHLDGQDTIWTYKHPVIAHAKFLVIFRGGRVDLSIMAVKDTSGRTHYLTPDDF